MVYIFLADLQCAKWMPSSLCVSRISLSSSRSSRLYLILSYIVDSLTFIARICDRCKFSSIVIKATGPHISWMNWTCHSQLIWRLATQIYRNCHRTWLRHHNWWNGDESNFPTLSKNIEQRREVHRIGQQTTISAFLHLRNLMYGGVNQRFPSNGNLIERGSRKI